jgi:hypothetical protein
LYLDSSANESESPIEKIIQTDLKFRTDTFYREYVRWEVIPRLYPKWVKANILDRESVHDADTWKKSWTTKDRPEKTFEVCAGDSGTPAFIVKDISQKKGIDHKLFFKAPIDTIKSFEVNLLDAIKDIAGKPSSSETKLIQDKRIIEEIWDNNLTNITGELIAGAKLLPEKLIWNQIYKKFFIDRGNGRHQILRAPREQRIIGIDTARSAKGCLMGVAMAHLEIGEKGGVVVVSDFTLAIGPDDSGINLEALNTFLVDLCMEGNLNLHTIAFDSFQSDQTIQNLKRLGMNPIKFSVDDSVEPYQYFVGVLHNRLFKSGKNIYLKNNLDSLYRGKDKKDNDRVMRAKGTPVHKYNGNWELSTAGKYEKDISDATCRAVYLLLHSKDIQPVTLYSEENRRLGKQDKAEIKVTEQYLMKRLYGIH